MALRLRLVKFMTAIAIVATSFHVQAKVLFFPDFAILSSKLRTLGAAGIKAVRNEAGETMYQFVDDTGAVISTFAYNKATAAALAPYRPSKLHTYLAFLGQQSGKIAIQKMMHMPAEVFTFFVAIGAIQTKHLIFDYASNPVAYDQFLTSQKSPVGQIAFGAFMMANGLTAEPLSVIAQTKTSRFFIPYLGMSAGMLASNVTHEVLSLPGIGKCALNLMGVPLEAAGKAVGVVQGDLLGGCDEAFDAWMKINWTEKGNEWAPSLFSLAASTLVGQLAETGAKIAAAQMVRLVGIEVATMMIPGPGWVVKGLRWGYKVANLAAIIYLSEELNTPFVFFWKNAIDLGPKLQDSQNQLTRVVGEAVSSNWKTPEKREAVTKELENYSELLFKWRQANMETILQKHGNWAQYLGQMSMEYKVARKFYFDFIGDVWKKTYELSPSYVHVMDRAMPLYGVKPNGFTEEDQNRFLQQPTKVEQAQMETVAIVSKWFFQDKKKETEAYVTKALQGADLEAFRSIQSGLSSQDPKAVGNAIQQMRFYLNVGVVNPSFQNEKLQAMLDLIYKSLGNPLPLMFPGQGYLKLLELDPNTTVYKENPFAATKTALFNPSAPEQMVQRMLLGPDVERGEKSVRSSMGFMAHFEPPRVIVDGDLQFKEMQWPKEVPIEVQQSIFGIQATLKTNDGKTIGGGAPFDILRDPKGLRASVIGDKNGSKIGEFWAKYPEKELRGAYRDYQEKYEEIVLELYQALFYKGKSFVNAGPVSNGILEAMETERDLYLYLLDAQLNMVAGKGSYAPQAGPDIEAERAKRIANNDAIIIDEHRRETVKRECEGELSQIRQPYLQSGEDYDQRKQLEVYNKLAAQHPECPALLSLTAPGVAQAPASIAKEVSLMTAVGWQLKATQNPWTKAMKAEWQNVNKLLSRIVQKEVAIPGKNNKELYLVTHVATSEFEEQVKRLDDLIENYPLNPDAKTPHPHQVTPVRTAELIQLTLKALRGVQQELMNYAQVINVVSFVETYEGNAINEAMRPQCLLKSSSTADGECPAKRSGNPYLIN